MALHKAMALMLALGAVCACAAEPLPPEVLAGARAALPPPAIATHTPSLQARAATAIMLAPSPDSKRIGTLAAGARVRAVSAVTGDGCVMGWVLLEPRGYVCGDLLDTSNEPPQAPTPPAKPGKQGFAGYDLVTAKTSLPIAVVVAPGGAPVWAASAPARALRRLPDRAFVPVLQLERNASKPPTAVAYRISETEWISARHARLISAAPVPPGYIDGERWLDIDLDAQTLAAYEGLMPVFVTLVSTGLEATPTPPGVFRIWKKMVVASSSALAEVARPVAPTTTQPPARGADEAIAWAQVFVPETGVGIYPWRRRAQFGTKASRGGVWISEADAGWLYQWTAPAHAPGWSMSAGVIESPGTLIQLRSKKNPTPALRGYALAVDEAQLARTPAYMNVAKP
ncbi:MAG: L,D-transpeptidase [Myxococcales bacterium]|nr:L,D-transpeptidase [Myxococcales bacterium]